MGTRTLFVFLLVLCQGICDAGEEAFFLTVSHQAVSELGKVPMNQSDSQIKSTSDGVVIASEFTVTGQAEVELVPHTKPAQIRLTADNQFLAQSRGTKGPVIFDFCSRAKLGANVIGSLAVRDGRIDLQRLQEVLTSPTSICLKQVRTKCRSFGHRFIRWLATRKILREIPGQEADLSETLQEELKTKIDEAIFQPLDLLSNIMERSSLDVLESEARWSHTSLVLKNRLAKSMPPKAADQAAAELELSISDNLATKLARLLFRPKSERLPENLEKLRGSLLDSRVTEVNRYVVDITSALASNEMLLPKQANDSGDDIEEDIAQDMGWVPMVLMSTIGIHIKSDTLVAVSFESADEEKDLIECQFEIDQPSETELRYRLAGLTSASPKISEVFSEFDTNSEWVRVDLAELVASLTNDVKNQPSIQTFLSSGWLQVRVGAWW